MKNNKQKVALVTGAGSGIGQNTATKLAKNGFVVVGCGRKKNKLTETEKIIPKGMFVPVVCDVANKKSVEQMFKKIKTKFGRLDVVFNNAGNNIGATHFGDVTFKQWRKVIGVNLDGAFLVANGAYKMMKTQKPKGGRIINNGSISAYMPRFGSAPYTASKHAITGLTKSIALDGRKHNIACGQIDIGNAASDMTKKMNKGVPQADGKLKPEPTMDVNHVGDAVAHMASLPLTANILFMNVMATKMPFVGRG